MMAAEQIRPDPSPVTAPARAALSARDLALLERCFPVLPRALVEILHVVDADDADCDAVARKLAVDPVIAAKILRLANASFYGLSGRINALRDAVAVLGLSSVRRLVLTLGICGQYQSCAPGLFDYKAAWNNCLWTALIADGLARNLGANAGCWFTAAIVQDLGQCALACAFPKDYAEVMRTFSCDPLQDIVHIEHEILGVDHASLGGELMHLWKMDPAIVRAVGGHHQPAASGDGDIVSGIQLANRLARADQDVPSDAEGSLPISIESLLKIVSESRQDFEFMARAIGD